VDRRPIDPPPIIVTHTYNPYHFMYGSLVSADSDEELHLLRDGKTRSTTGSIVSSLYRLKDLDGKEGAYFVFPDLSVRMEGSYRLKVTAAFRSCTSIPLCIGPGLYDACEAVWS
ncbi:uncharacterized protein BJ171DRAFT_419202, partial [Polychytrium aggregatum]|uniref:uncharacterized protein n=1 Tax=Polychytrium aggregatum TaxID=110093 RepID=UPI0022FDE753